jgi:hypothetical protein
LVDFFLIHSIPDAVGETGGAFLFTAGDFAFAFGAGRAGDGRDFAFAFAFDAGRAFDAGDCVTSGRGRTARVDKRRATRAPTTNPATPSPSRAARAPNIVTMRVAHHDDIFFWGGRYLFWGGDN